VTIRLYPFSSGSGKDDTRRKILLGSYLIKKMKTNETNKEKILAELNEYLIEDRDRKLFDLSCI